MAKRTWSETNQALDRFVKSEKRRLGVPGVSVGVLHRGRRYTQGYGVTNVDHPLPVLADTLFQIGSTTKTFTASAIIRLVEQGKLDLNVPVRRYLPDFRLKNKEAERKATLMHLMTHTGGWLGDYFGEGGRGDDSLAKIIASMAKLKQLTPLGEVWSYNNSGFYLAGRIIEKVTKKTYEAAIRELIFEPLGMDNSFFFAEEVLPFRTVVGHITRNKKATVVRQWALDRSVNPAGGIISNVGDQLTWAAFHMGDGKAPSGKRLLRKSSLNFMKKDHAPAGSMADTVGISWLMRTVDGHKLVSHGGTTTGQLSAFSMVPERDFAVTVLTNSTTGGQLHRSVVSWTLEHYLGLEQPTPTKIRISKEDLSTYAGNYRQESSGNLLAMSVRNGGLVLKMPTPPPLPSGKKQPAPPLIPLSFIGPDKVAAMTGYFKGTSGEFLRSSSGRIAWFRFGGRIQRRVKS